MEEFQFLPGKPLPLGATVFPDGVNFSIFSRNGTSVILELFHAETDGEPAVSYVFEPAVNRTGDVWHVFVKGLKKNALYLYRVDGPFYPNQGLRFNANNYLIDPYAKALTGPSIFRSLREGAWKRPNFDADLVYSHVRSAAGFPKCVVVDGEDFDWQGDVPLNYPLRTAILYEMHVRGLTASPSGGFSAPGPPLRRWRRTAPPVCRRAASWAPPPCWTASSPASGANWAKTPGWPPPASCPRRC